MFSSSQDTVFKKIFLNSESKGSHLCDSLTAFHFIMTPRLHNLLPIWKIRWNDIFIRINQPSISPCWIWNRLIWSHRMIWWQKPCLYVIVRTELLFSFINQSYICTFRSKVYWWLTSISFITTINEIFLKYVKKSFFFLKFASWIFSNTYTITM